MYFRYFMRSAAARVSVLVTAVVVLAMVFIFAPSSLHPLYPGDRESGEETPAVAAGPGETPGETEIQVPPPPFSEDIFPCSQCHAEQETNTTRRQLTEMHEDIVLNHAQQNRWCLDCHDAANRDMLHMADGELLDFKESYKLCGQCHGPKLRDWRNGVHGKRTGSWNGRKEYLLCVHCHNPHSPRFKKLKPEPPPRKPGSIKQ